ncbi:MAG: hypothetical protein JW829_16470, partial [Pirellulales bacterium]|nr:hypothetical protein [Pirellulales bacterium]
DPLDFSRGWCPRVVEMYQYYQSVFFKHPELKRLVRLVLPDLQGPFDNLELIVGSDVFTQLYTHEDLVSKALQVMATAQIGFARYLEPYLSDGPGMFSHQHAVMIKGGILLRDDSVIMVSPEMYRALLAPHDEQVLREFGGGGVHICGKAESHALAFLELPSILCLDLGQPELNDMDKLYVHLERRRIPLTRMKVSRYDLATARIMDRFPTGVSLLYEADSLLDAKETMEAYIRATG